MKLAAAFLCGYLLCAFMSSGRPPQSSNPELKTLYDQDQSDRQTKTIDWHKVGARDSRRKQRIMEIYAADQIRTGEDYYRAAMVLQHGEGDDQLLAHEFSVAALALGYKKASWLAVAAEDRWLERIGRKQRFATQYSMKVGETRFKLRPVDPVVRDSLRRVMGAPTLAQAKKREEEINR